MRCRQFPVLRRLGAVRGLRRAVLPFFAVIGARPAKLAKRLRMEGTTRRVRSASSAAGEHSTYLCDAFMGASRRTGARRMTNLIGRLLG